VQIGIVGLPKSGKTTVFNALTGQTRPTASYTATRLEVITATVDVVDERLDKLAALYKPRKTTYAKVTFADVGGLEKGAGSAGLSGPFRNQISKMDAFVHVVRAFEDFNLPHPEGNLDPARDLEMLDTEFVLSDLIAIEKRLERLDEELKKGATKNKDQNLKEQALMQRLKGVLDSGQYIRDIELSHDEDLITRPFGFLTQKPVLALINSGEPDEASAANLPYSHRHSMVANMAGKLEMELAQLSPEDAAEFAEAYAITEPARHRIIRLSYDLLGLNSFFTVGEDECRAWALGRGETALDAAGTIHTDLAHGFIRAEVTAWNDLLACGSEAAARTQAKMHLEGKEYLVKDGEIVHIRFTDSK